MKVKHSLLVDDKLYPVFERLLKEPVTHELRYKLKRIGAKMDQKQKDHVVHMNGLLSKFGELGADGKPLFELNEEGKAIGYKLKDGDSFKEALKEYLDSEFEIEVTPIFAADLKDIKMSVVDGVALSPFVADPDNL